jgi:hypothetical protein
LQRVEDISVVVVDYNNIPQEMVKMMGAGHENGRNFRMPSARSSSMKGSFFTNVDLSNISLPSQLRIYQEVLTLITIGDTEGVIEMIKKLKIQEIVAIRGLNLLIEDIQVESECPVDTVMWNPLYFSVYYQNYDLVKFLIKDMRINIGISTPKSNADNERDAVNNDRYPEDKIMLLLLAYDRRNPQILKFLLDEGYRFWPLKTIPNLL